METEYDPLLDILSWSEKQPPWQRDALRRLATKSRLSSNDVKELTSICKNAESEHPLVKEHLRVISRGEGQVRLASISEVRSVNALAEGQRLTFQSNGLTIIYGDNGSGKSGYARILKTVCRARIAESDGDIEPDIHGSKTASPSAEIEYSIGEEKRSYAWESGRKPDAALSNISVFDSRSANVHVDAENDIAYTPFPLKLLGSLAKLCGLIGENLEGEIRRIKDQSPEVIREPKCDRNTKVGKLLLELSADTLPASLHALASLSQDENNRLKQLTIDLAEEPDQASRKLLHQKKKVEEFQSILDKLLTSLRHESISGLQRLRKESLSAAQAASVASSELFREEPMPQIGSDAWRTLWESARAFSESDAYPKQIFPVTGDRNLCVLCLQPLLPEASTRMERFEAFVQADSQQRADKSLTDYETAIKTFADAAISVRYMRGFVTFLRDELRQENLAKNLRGATLRYLWRHREIRLHRAELSTNCDAPVFNCPRHLLVNLTKTLEAKANSFSSESGSANFKALISEKLELENRRWLKSIESDVLAEIDRLKQIKGLEAARRDTSTRNITRKSTEIAQYLITDALYEDFSKEVKRLRVSGPAVNLRKSKSVKGEPKYKISFDIDNRASLGKVLSEGEYRCIALAAFMAELATNDNKSGIVFDDPVSSLDHMHRECVAKRLVEEAEKRQVIVFTHDLTFLFALDRAARDLSKRSKAPVTMRSINRGGDKVGICKCEAPFKARRVEDIVAGLRKRLCNDKYHFQEGDSDKWSDSVKAIAERLRETWEIAVEEVVGHVIKRLSNEVKTDGLIKLSVITAKDHKLMREGYKSCSELMHSSSSNVNSPTLTPEELEVEIDKLGNWVSDLKGRQKSAR